MSTARTDSRRMRGVSLALKLALVIAAVVALFMAGFGLFLVTFIEETMEQQVMASAVESARAASQADYHAWTPWYGTEDQGLSTEARGERLRSMSVLERRIYEENQGRLDQVDWNSGRFRRFLGDDSHVLAAELFRFEDGLRAGLVASSYRGEMSFAPVVGAVRRSFGRGEAIKGVFTAGNRSFLAIRGSHPVLGRDGEVQGEIAIYIDAQAVTDAGAAFKLKVSYAAMLFVLLGAVISFALGKGVTRPLKRLQEDMRIVASGDLQHHTRTHSSDEIGELARTFDALTRSLAEAEQTKREAAASRHEVAVASEVAESLIPHVLPSVPGHDLAGLHEGPEGLSGEMYDVVDMPGGRLGLIVAQASGHGAPAALVMAMARTFLRVVAEREADPGAVLREVNGRLAGDLREGMYVSALLAVLEPLTGRLVVANAGQPAFLHYHADGERVSAVHSEGIALGFDSGPVFDRTLKLVERVLEPGDRVLLHNAGVAALVGGDGQPLGEKRLGALLKREGELAAESFVGRADATLRRFAGGEYGSHVTLLTLGRLPS